MDGLLCILLVDLRRDHQSFQPCDMSLVSLGGGLFAPIKGSVSSVLCVTGLYFSATGWHGGVDDLNKLRSDCKRWNVILRWHGTAGRLDDGVTVQGRCPGQDPVDSDAPHKNTVGVYTQRLQRTERAYDSSKVTMIVRTSPVNAAACMVWRYVMAPSMFTVATHRRAACRVTLSCVQSTLVTGES